MNPLDKEQLETIRTPFLSRACNVITHSQYFEENQWNWPCGINFVMASTSGTEARTLDLLAWIPMLGAMRHNAPPLCWTLSGPMRWRGSVTQLELSPIGYLTGINAQTQEYATDFGHE